jgi:hypothetical protein
MATTLYVPVPGTYNYGERDRNVPDVPVFIVNLLLRVPIESSEYYCPTGTRIQRLRVASNWYSLLESIGIVLELDLKGDLTREFLIDV